MQGVGLRGSVSGFSTKGAGCKVWDFGVVVQVVPEVVGACRGQPPVRGERIS